MHPLRKSFQTASRSIAIQISLMLAGLSLMAVTGIVSSMMVAETLAGDAAAINLSGSIRMLTLRVLQSRLPSSTEQTQNAIQRLESILYSKTLQQSVQIGQNANLVRQLTQLQSRWQQDVRPFYLNQKTTTEKLAEHSNQFIEQADQLVQQLQKQSENKITRLKTIQGSAIVLVILMSVSILLLIRSRLIRPLNTIMVVTEHFRQGQFDNHIHCTNNNELGVLSQSINQMLVELSTLYQKQEQRVAAKTRQLQLSNQSLQILYDNTRLLYSNPDDIYAMLPGILGSLQTTLNLGRITLCLRKQDDSPAFKLITSDHSNRPSFCQHPHCNQCRTTADKTLYAPHLASVVQFAVISGDHHYGDISVELESTHSLDDWKHHLMSAMADIIATKLNLSQNSEKESRMVLMEERAAIARELHDSLAQSLSYQKIQVTRLKKLLQTNAETDLLYEVIADVQNGLNQAYKDLRELISAFRINVHEPGMEAAIHLAIDEFRKRTALSIKLEYQIQHCPLTPNEETHCLHIIREALSNVIKHAQASQAQVRLHQLENGQGQIVIEVEDNGIGMPAFPTKPGHYGLSILTERTRHLHGKLDFKTTKRGGTLVHVQFHPHFLQSTFTARAI